MSSEDKGSVHRSVSVIRFVHTVLFVVLSAILVAFLYEVIADRITFITWFAVGLFTLEGIVLVANGCRCPITAYTESLGSNHGQITDVLLPKWFADRVFVIYGALYAAGFILLIARLLTGG